jgi:hypothetical protein
MPLVSIRLYEKMKSCHLRRIIFAIVRDEMEPVLPEAGKKSALLCCCDIMPTR